MLDKLETSKRAGMFGISPGRRIFGEITLSGPNTTLYLQDDERFETHGLPDQYLAGSLLNGTQVSLLGCVTFGEGSAPRKEGDRYYNATVFPHYVVLGDRQLCPSDSTISEVQFVIDDASTLFYDFDAFGAVLDPQPLIEQVAHANVHVHHRKIATGPDPIICYFSGKREIFSVDTVFGRVSASHDPDYGLGGGPDGVFIKNRIVVSLAFQQASTFNQTISNVTTLIRYLELMIGRPQNVLSLTLIVESQQQAPAPLQVYWSMRPKRDSTRGTHEPHPADVLIDTVRQPEAFGGVLARWLEQQQERHDARFRFSNSFANQNRYDIDRLVSSANMFDILPPSAIPPDVPLSDELQTAKTQCRGIFKALPPSPERGSILNALGRLGKSVLKHKVRLRAQFVIDAVGARFPELATVTDEAVNCRNHYVHGTPARFDYFKHTWATSFFTNTLEFVFAASELIEAGWDIAAWSDGSNLMSHPFACYRIEYAESLSRLKSALKPQQNTS